MVGAQQEGAAAAVRVGVGDFSGAATPTSNRDTHFKCLHTQIHTCKRVTASTAGTSFLRVAEQHESVNNSGLCFSLSLVFR